eukprot:CAMPEP_0204583196 /NCGR_PEP_ID=MMETSP0661-20131031/45638_1 /ASSEMBLY_ACC=CAM_ASM_000606 /TAXON_ID=109239 /ORGANISM="Alexandrium margalefi, Strain AMGDE01CS-322" /LENGTH=32 /DNA_ID= /DNA_START= /DNA_END= /DNA_ORIENTATION=
MTHEFDGLVAVQSHHLIFSFAILQLLSSCQTS